MSETAPQQTPEVFARSLHNLYRYGGSLALAAETGGYGEAGERAVTFANYTSALREMLLTDKELRQVLNIDDRREHAMAEGKVLADNGETLESIIDSGIETSQAAARFNPEMTAQVIRDQGDKYTLSRVEALQPGQAYFALSMNPREELQAYRKTYRGLGYREELDFLQWYALGHDGILRAGSISIDLSDEKTWRRQFTALGVHVPVDATPNTWIQHGFERDMDADEAEIFAGQVRTDYYERRGAKGPRFSISEYLEQRSDIVEGLFDSYYPSLATAIYEQRNNETLQAFAQTLLTTANLTKMKAEARQHLMRVANSQKFDAELGRAMDDILRYAVVEELRVDLERRIRLQRFGFGDALQGLARFVTSPTVDMAYNFSSQAWNHRLAGRVEAGIEAERSYGGCSNVDLNEEEDLASALSPQGSFGGRIRRGRGGSHESEDDEVMRCVNCPKCGTEHDEVRPDKDGYYCCKNKQCKHKVKRAPRRLAAV